MMGTMKGWETRRKLAEAHDEAMKAAGAAAERGRVRKLVETLQSPDAHETLNAAFHSTHSDFHVDFGNGWEQALRELLRRLEEK